MRDKWPTNGSAWSRFLARPAESERLSRESGKTKFLLVITPARVLCFFIFCMILAELAEALLHVHFFPALSGNWRLLLDVVDTTLILIPAYFLLYLPFRDQWRRQQVVRRELERREERLVLALEGIQDGVWDWNVTTGEAYFSPRGELMLGYEPGEIEPHIRSWENFLHPEDQDRTMELLQSHLEGKTSHYESEHRLRAKSGEWKWIHARGRVTDRDGEGRPLRMVGTYTDISRRKQAEEEIRLLTRRLISTAEEERKRFAQDLHDEFGQNLTALQLGMEILRNTIPEDHEEQRRHCQRLIELISQLGDHVRDISASLLPSMLADLGLVPTLGLEVRKLRRQWTGIRIDYQARGLEGRLPPEMELALYRIFQEAVSNVARHAEAERVEVILERTPSQVSLTVSDDGKGFLDEAVPLQPESHRGIGLLGMRERAEALGGSMNIHSGMGEGTTLRVVFPLPAAEA